MTSACHPSDDEKIHVLRIELLSHQEGPVAQRIHRLLVQAHEQETRLLNVEGIMPLDRSSADIQSSDDYFLGALLADKLVGVISVGLDDEPGQILVKSLLVHAEHQRKNIASALVVEALRLGNGAAFSVITAEGNAPALALYHKLGFSVYKRGALGPAMLAMVKLRRPGAHDAG